ELSLRTTPGDVRRIVEYSVTELRSRLSQLEARVDDLDTRVRNLEAVVFPGGYRVVEKNGETLVAQADVFRFVRQTNRQWRDKQNGPLASGTLVQVSPDGVTIREMVAGAAFEKMLDWDKLAVADQHYIEAAVKTEGWPMNGKWYKVAK
ncbi:MAG: hypothetical protein KDD69_12630, partial [Bdellovibrionales bacterium]|nr:hypothetical protein [Bdellovibrionales bacterium]